MIRRFTGGKGTDGEGHLQLLLYFEQKTIVTKNIIPALAFTPKNNSCVVLYVWGQKHRNGTDFTVSGKTITWVAATAGFDIDPDDDVFVVYEYENADIYQSYEQKTIVTKNVIPNLSFDPKNTSHVILYVNGQKQENGVDFSVVGRVVTWDEVTAGFDIETTDDVFCCYEYE